MTRKKKKTTSTGITNCPNLPGAKFVSPPRRYLTVTTVIFTFPCPSSNQQKHFSGRQLQKKPPPPEYDACARFTSPLQFLVPLHRTDHFDSARPKTEPDLVICLHHTENDQALSTLARSTTGG